MSLTRLILARHGETTGQSSVRYFGATDVPLSDVGRAQIRLLASRLVSERPSEVVTSRLGRAVEAGEIVASACGAPLRSDPAWNEVDFGAWEGLTREEIVARDPHLYARWIGRDPDFAYPGGGTVSREFRVRVASAVESLLAEAAGRTVVVVSHAGVVRAAIGHLFGFPPPERPSIAVDLASIHVVEAMPGGERRLVVENDASHARHLLG